MNHSAIAMSGGAKVTKTFFTHCTKSHHVLLKSTNFNPHLLILWEGEKKGTGGRLSKREERRADSYLSDYTGNYRGGRSGGIAFFGETL